MLLSDAAMCALIFYMVPSVTSISQVKIHLAAWVIFLLIHFLACDLCAGRGISFNLYVVMQAAVIGAGAAWVVKGSYCAPGFDAFPYLLAGCVAVAGIHGATIAYRLPAANGILRYVDGLIVMLAFYLYAVFDTGQTADGGAVLLSLAAIVVDLAAVNQIRTREEGVSVIRGSGTGSRVMMAGIASVILILTGWMAGAASGRIHSAVDLFLYLAGKIAAVLAMIYHGIGYVLSKLFWLLGLLFPDTLDYVQEDVAVKVGEEAAEVVQEAGKNLPAWVLAVLLAAAAILAVVWVFHHFRHTKLKRRTEKKTDKKVVRTSHLLPALRQVFARLADLAGFEMRYRKNRDTPEGLLIFAQRVGLRGRSGRRKDESPGEYMRRIGGILKEREDAGTEGGGSGRVTQIGRLAEMLDEIYYGGRTVSLSREDCREYRNIIEGIFK